MFGSKKINITVSVTCLLAALLAILSGRLGVAIIFAIAGSLPWLRIVSVQMVAEHKKRMSEMAQEHNKKVSALESGIRRLKSRGS